jgi:two-component system, LytTR family, sensor histidine kinase AlgZ
MRIVNGSSKPPPELPIGLSWLGLLAVLVLIALAVAAQLSDYQQIGVVHVVILTFVGSCFAGAYVLVHKLIVEKLEPRARPWQKFVIRAIAVVVAVLVGTEVASQAVAAMGGDLHENRRNYFPVGFAVTAAAAIVDYAYQRLRSRARELQLREERARRQAIHAELSALRARTDPHFLFNSLNAVAGLIEENPRKASEAIERLAGLFRYALEGSRRETVRLGDETRAVEAFLELEAIRFGERFRWRVDMPSELLDVEVPPLFLQPLVENAVIHGAGSKRGPATVEVRGSQHGGRLRIEVEDDGAGMGNSPAQGSGTAMSDLRERLALLYDGSASLKTGTGVLGGVLVTIELPIAQGAQ